MSTLLNPRRTGAICALATLAACLGAATSQGDLPSRYSAGQQLAGQLSAGIQADTHRLQGYQGTIDALQARLAVIQSSVSTQERLLSGVRAQLSGARLHLQDLKRQYGRDRALLAAQLRSEYETPLPTVVGVIVNAHGFEDLLNGLNSLKAIERENARVTTLVATQRLAVAAQTHRLTVVQARRQRATAAVLVERDQVAQLRLSVVTRKLAVAGLRAQKLAQLNSLRRTLSREAAVLDQRAAAAQAASSGGAGVAPGGCVSTPFVAHGGPYGFFPAAGTNYSVGQEPIIAARLDALGRALQLQLTGISGYRTPQHSVEVGGFADDPHTQGIASDTPGVEGVPEATLARFCLTRPFPGPREADHIQEI